MRHLLIDLDGTCIETMGAYYAAYDRVCALAARWGHDPAVMRERIGKNNKDYLARNGSTAAFPRALEDAFCQLERDAGREPDLFARHAVMEIGNDVFRCTLPPLPHVHEVLATLRRRYRLWCYTMGDEPLQLKRLDDARISQYFTDVICVHAKQAAVLAATMAQLGAGPADVCVVGDSLRSDIEPAVTLCVDAVWVRGAGGWAYDQHPVLVPDTAPFWVADTLCEVPDLLHRCWRDA